MNTNFVVFGLIRLGIKPVSTTTEADALTTLPSFDPDSTHGYQFSSLKFR